MFVLLPGRHKRTGKPVNPASVQGNVIENPKPDIH
ncbi:MAG TPA: hypothetical protein ENJ29_10615 [Bacteroidetes bacterium]|nr:hypothetical protein [Bacteroidota bacterium]